VGARAVLIVGGEGLPVKDMRSGEQRDAADPAEALKTLSEVLA